MNILQSLVDEAQKKRKQLQNVVSNDVVHPVEHAAANVVNAVSAHNTVAPVVRAVTHAPQAFITHVSAPVDRFAIKSPIGRGAQSVALGALQDGVEGVQGISGLDDALNHKLGLYQGASPTSTKLTSLAKNTDITAKNEHSNPLLYHGSQVATNLLGLAAGGEVADAAKATSYGTRATSNAARLTAKLNPSIKIPAAVTTKLTPTAESGIVKRVAAKSAKNIVNPKYQAVNAAFTAEQSGQQIAQGRKVTPKDVATSLAVGGVAFPIAGAAGGEVVGAGVKAAKNAPAVAKNAAKLTADTTHDIISQKPHRNITDAELSSAQKVRNSMQGGGSSMDLTEKDMANYRNIQRKLGVGMNDHNAVDDAIGARRTYETRQAYLKQPEVSQGGYARIPGGEGDPAPDLHPKQKDFINEYANMLDEMDQHTSGGDMIPDGHGGYKRISSNSKFYRDTYAQTGKPPTKAQYFDEARQQIESGRAMYGASEEYAKLPKAAAEQPLEIPPGFEGKAPETKTYNTIHHSGVIQPVKGQPIDLVKGVDTFLHKDENGNWVVSEASTGMNLTNGGFPNQQLAINAAKSNIQSVGEPKLKEMLGRHQLSAPKAQKIVKKAEDDFVAGKISPAEMEKVQKNPAAYSKKYTGKPYDMSQGPPDFLKPEKAAKSAKAATPGTASKPSANGKTSLQAAPELPIKIRSEAGRPPKGTKLLQETKTAKAKASSKTKYSENPTKVDVPTVAAGDYEKARGNAQLASAPINYAAGQAARTARTLKLSTSKLGRLVEGTDKPKNVTEEEAIRRYRQYADRVHATSQALGGKTKYRPDYFHHEWDLSNPEDAARFEEFRQRKFGKEYNYSQFEGLDTQPRVFDTVAQGEKAGFKLKYQNAAEDILAHGNSSAHALRQQALAKGFAEADANELEKPHAFDIGQGKTIALSNKGRHEIRSFAKAPPVSSPALKAYRGTNRKLKQTLLSASEFHPINITKKVAPGLALEGHPVLAAKGAYGAFRAQIGRGYSDKLQQQFQEKGLVDFGARVGSPLKFGSDYAAEGKLDLGHAGFGEKTIFEKSMPALHGRALEALQKDLDARHLSYDSPEARAAGTRINELMGFVNTEFRNLDRGHQRALSDIALAPQFTRAKWATLKSALKDTRLNNSSLAGSYARRAVVGEAATQAAAIVALGYVMNQKSDDIRDMIIRAIVHPAVPTPMKDSKGNTIELGMPSTFASEALGLVANIERGKDGHLHVKFRPDKIGQNLEDYGRARLAIVPGAALKLKTNTDFASKPLYDPNAPAKDQAQQAAATLLGGTLPIGAQGLLYNESVNKHLPEAVREIYQANKPGSDPAIKSVASSFGLTPRTDKTVGKGRETTKYFDALGNASKGLNRQEQDALDLYTGGKKNPVTKKYEVMPNANDARAKASTLLQNPKVVDHLIDMNKKLAADGQKVDPLWSQSKDKITKYLQYQAMAPGSADKTDWTNKNSWYYGNPNNKNDKGLAGQRTAFFDSLPPGDPNKPKLNLQYPDPTPQIRVQMDEYNNLNDPKAKGEYLDAHPGVIDQWRKQSKYTNDFRQALGYAPLKDYPEASQQLQSFIDSYSATDKGSRKAIRNSNPKQYQEMISYFDSLDLYGIGKQAAVSQLQGEPDYTSKEAKQISSLAKDIYQNPDGTYSIVPAGWMNGLSNSQFGSSQKGRQMSLAKSFKSPTEGLVKYSTKGAALARAAHLSTKGRKISVTSSSVKLAKLPKRKALA